MFLFSNRKKTLNHPLLFSHYGLIFRSGKLPQRRQALPEAGLCLPMKVPVLIRIRGISIMSGVCLREEALNPGTRWKRRTKSSTGSCLRRPSASCAEVSIFCGWLPRVCESLPRVCGDLPCFYEEFPGICEWSPRFCEEQLEVCTRSPRSCESLRVFCVDRQEFAKACGPFALISDDLRRSKRNLSMEKKFEFWALYSIFIRQQKHYPGWIIFQLIFLNLMLNIELTMICKESIGNFIRQKKLSINSYTSRSCICYVYKWKI